MRIASFLFPECRDPSNDGRYIHETLEEARLAEALGCDAVFLAEHHFDGNCVYVDPPVFATAIAMATTRVKIGFAVIQASLHHPIRLAEQLSLLDHLSKGRLIIGLGRGSIVNTHEYKAYEIEMEEAQARFEELEGILIRCWTEERFVHHGKYWNFEMPMLRPRPCSKPRPLIMRGAASEGSIVAQAKLGHPIMLTLATGEGTKRSCDLIRKTMSEAGFDGAHVQHALDNSWVFLETIVAETDREAVEVGLPYARQMQEYRLAQSANYRGRLLNLAPGAVPDGMLCGSPDTVLKQIQAVHASGIGGVMLKLRLGPMPVEFSMRSLRLFMKQVAPALR